MIILIEFFVYLAVGFAIYGPFLRNPFLMDDELQITGSQAIQNLQNWPQFFLSSTMDSGGMKTAMGGIYFKPLMTLYYALMWSIDGANPFVFRLPLLLMHIGSAFLISRFLLNVSHERFTKPIALAAGMIFLVHPANSEIVAYLADAQDALFLFWGLLALNIACVGGDSIGKPPAHFHTRIRIARWTAIAILLLMSLLSKETGALFVLGVPFFTFLFRRTQLAWSLAASAIAGGIYAAFRIASGLLTYHHSVLILHQATWWERMQTLPLILWHYIEIIFFPWRISTVTDFVVKEIGVENFWLPFAGDLLALGLLTWLTARVCRNSRQDPSMQNQSTQNLALIALTWIAMWYGLHGNAILPLDGSFADRWLYFAFLPIIIFSLLTLEQFEETQTLLRKKNLSQILIAPFGKLLSGLFLAVLIALSVRTFVRLGDWEVPKKLYMRELELHPRDAIMANNVGVEIFRAGDALQARPYFELATQINPMWDVARNNLGATYQRAGDLETARSNYLKAIRLGTYALAYENYAQLTCGPDAFKLSAPVGTTPGEASRQAIGKQCDEFLNFALEVFPNNAVLRNVASYRHAHLNTGH